MPHADFVHLRVHTSFSLSEGALRIVDLAKLCVADAMPAVAMTDRGNLFGAMEFSAACAAAGVQPIIGCVLAIGEAPEPGVRRPEPTPIVVLARNETGYRHLVKLVSASFLETAPGDIPQVLWTQLKALNDGLIAFTGGPAGPVDRLLMAGQGEAADLALAKLGDIFPGRLYVELQRHGGTIPAIEAALLDLAYRRGLPLVATNDVHFADASMYEAHDALLCVADGETIGRAERRRLTPDHRFKSAAEMRGLFADIPEAIDNTIVIARRCAVQAPKREPILPRFPDAGAGGEAALLRQQAEVGLDRRLDAHVFTPGMDAAARAAAAAPYRARLDFELGVIEAMKFPGYFLIVADFIQWAKRQGIPVGPGRGSGAGSVAAWSLTITDLDPLRHGLLFERFLNPERVSMPDFDIDFCQERRDEVIRYVAGRYGTDRVAQIITFGTLQARAALRDVGRVLEMAYGQVDRLCKLVPYNPAHPVKLAEAIEREPQLQEARDSDLQVKRLLDIALKLEGLHRHASTHAAGIVIGDRPLDELVPLYRDPRSSMPVTQFHMKDVEKAGLVKFDFLGLKTLSVLHRAIELLANRGVTLDLATLPLDDAPTYAVLSRGDTAGIFQLEGAGVRDVVRRLRPDTFSDIVALVALYRPGPMDNIPRFVACKHGEEQPDYMLPQLEPILRETYGVIVYQEQVMQIAQVLGGFNLGAADLLRRAMGKKIKKEMEAQRDAFLTGALANGVGRAQATQVFDLLARFADYGFNKSHAAAYALVAYQTAYLKAHHPVEFLAASMSFELANTDRLNVFREESEHLGVRVLAPDLNRSEANFGVEEGAVRYGLAAVKGVGLQAMEAVVAERRRGGPFADLADFADRVDSRAINRRQLEGLVRAGACDGLNPNRAQVLAGIDAMIARAGAAARSRDSGQVGLFDGGEAIRVPLPLPDVPDWAPVERLRQEHDALGFYLSAHPLTAYVPALAKLGVPSSSSLAAMLANVDEAEFRLAGVPIARRERTGNHGRRFAFVQMSDVSGTYEVVMFHDILAASRDLLDSGAPLLLLVDARRDGDTVRLAARTVQALDRVVAASTQSLRVVLDASAGLNALRSALLGSEKGSGTVRVVVRALGADDVEILLPGGYALTPSLWARLAAAPGIAAVEAG
ncbi:MAG: DNA polymerase III subunit alpha [Alphaproteobacteria bacterium]|nr:DNA polymerase III subunit alpha [Alphaproteobacteria bacterium]